MNNNKILLALLITASVIFSIIISSCEITDPVKGLEVRLNTISRESIVNLFIKDAVTDQIIRNNVTVRFNGSNASKIIDVNNSHKTVFNTTSGFITFSIEDGTVYNENEPFIVTVQIESDSYETDVSNVYIYSQGVQSRTRFMVSEANLPDNSYQGDASAGTADNTGTVQQDATATTDNGTTVTIPAGTQMTASDGQPLTGDITTTVQTVPISGSNDNLAPSTVTTTDNQTVAPVAQVTVSFNDQSGNTAANVTTTASINIIVPVDPTLINPITGSPYQIGDRVELRTLDKNTGNYAKTGEGVVVSQLTKMLLVNSGLAFDITTNSNSNNSFGSKSFITSTAVTTCNVKLITTQTEIESYGFELYFGFVSSETTPSPITVSGSEFLNGYILENKVIDNLPDRYVEVKYEGTRVAYLSPLECGDNALMFDLNQLQDTYTIDFSAIGVCEISGSPPVVATLSRAGYTYYNIDNPDDIKTGQVEDGNGTVTITPGTYHVSIEYDGENYSGNVTITDDGIIETDEFDTSSLFFGELKVDGVTRTIDENNNPLIDGQSVTVYVKVEC
ncbi:MAG: hypothetical protein JW995_07265 [Melioribacteraceae bacterium]|nr:hypothetical protein [Melioribacteraceae bacterium]